ncbi:hypothetical protein U14_00230 [Candidatus Moduliflexus flocculans]|uniref:Uncharacterized protein n=1 Tax=Candidatus Moduliflexus flocculans TaxID=1499966 RepID=A0A0S6VSW9_9BACT|nr:hypothetical protein U14_00230 [Candidatus Moduliflexus flocculans]
MSREKYETEKTESALRREAIGTAIMPREIAEKTFSRYIFLDENHSDYFSYIVINGPLAQLVEQLTLGKGASRSNA